MNQRIRELRKSLGLTLENFGKRVGVGKTAISRLENGSNGVTPQMFKSICRECWNGKFVNEEWLRNGIGEMFIELPEEDEVAGYVSDLLENQDNPFFTIIVEAMRTFNQLTPENQVAVLTYSKQLLENLQKKEG